MLTLDVGLGVNRNSKTLERARQDSERRKDEEARLTSELENALLTTEQTLSAVTAVDHASTDHAAPPPTDGACGTVSFQQQPPPFSMPVVAQSSFNMFDFLSRSPPPRPRDDTTSSASEESYLPYARSPSTAVSTSPLSSSSSPGSAPRTPGLSASSLSAGSSSSSSQDTSFESLSPPQWSRDLFGGDASDNEEERPPGAEPGYDFGDLFGDADADDGDGEDARDAYGNLQGGVEGAVLVRLFSSLRFAPARWSLTCAQVDHGASDPRLASSSMPSTSRARAVAWLARPAVLYAARMALSSLPAVFSDNEDEERGGRGSAFLYDDYDSVSPFRLDNNHHDTDQDTLSRLSPLFSLQALPDPGAFERLSLS